MMFLRCHASARRRRGSVIILVLAVLATLSLLAISFSYSSRMELIAARNWSNGVQARIAAVTGIPLYNAAADAQGGIVSPKSSALRDVQIAAESSVSSSLLTTADDAATTRDPDLAPVNLRLKAENASTVLGIETTGNGVTTRNKSTQLTFKSSNVLGEQTAVASNSSTLAGGENLNSISKDPAKQLAAQTLTDPAGRLNINAVVPASIKELRKAQSFTAAGTSGSSLGAATPPFISEDTLATLIQTVMDAKSISGSGAQQLAHAIALHRFGTDGKPGRAGHDDDADALLERERLALLAGQTSLVSILRKQVDPQLSDLLDNNLDGQIDNNNDVQDDIAECSGDPRKKGTGDDLPYGALSELLAIDGMTPALYTALAPCLTIFSASHEAFVLPADSPELESASVGDLGWPRVDPNTASAVTLYKTLRARYPQADAALLGQFTVNMIDRRDTDDVPTTLVIDGESYTGIELTPCLNEVCPDTRANDDDGDNGQYVEITNPYTKAMSLSGWTLQGGGVAVQLKGSLPSGGYLVVTDDYNDSNESTEVQQQDNGSFYSIFGVAPDGNKRQLQEATGFTLPNDEGSVKLVNPKGQVVDVFEWSGGKWTGQNTSLQRIDPRLRYSERGTATPMAVNVKGKQDTAAQAALTIQQDWQNKPFRSGLDVMLVSSAFVAKTASSLSTSTLATSNAATSSSSGSASTYALPVLIAGGSNQLDVRLVDCFQVGVRLPDAAERRALLSDLLDESRQTADSAKSSATSSHSDQQLERYAEALVPTCATRFGAINLNTAPIAVLAALPGMTTKLLNAIAQRRAAALATSTEQTALAHALDQRNNLYWKAGSPFDSAVWTNLSDFLMDDTLWSDSTTLYDRLDAVYEFLPLLVTHSQSMAMGTANLTAEKQERNPARMQTQRILAFDRGRLETLSFRYEGLGLMDLGDSDLRLAQPISKAKPAFSEAQLLIQASAASAATKKTTTSKSSASNSNSTTGKSSSGSMSSPRRSFTSSN